VRNVLIAIGNSNDPALVDVAEELIADPAALVRGAAIWALHRLAPGRLAAHADAARRETDPVVRHEWASARGEVA
jgi:epoxyqueuosine reductase